MAIGKNKMKRKNIINIHLHRCFTALVLLYTIDRLFMIGELTQIGGVWLIKTKFVLNFPDGFVKTSC